MFHYPDSKFEVWNSFYVVR